MTYSWLDLGFYFLLYSFLGWTLEAASYGVMRRRFFDRGLLSLPLLPSYGIAFVLMIVVLPGLGDHRILQFIATLVIVSVVESISDHMVRGACKKLRLEPERDRLFSGSGRGPLASAGIALGYYLVYLVIHPLFIGLGLLPDLLAVIVAVFLLLLIGLSLLLPELISKLLAVILLIPLVLVILLPGLVKAVAVIGLLALTAADFAATCLAIRRGDPMAIEARQEKSGQNRLATRLYSGIWHRLQKAYPGIGEGDAEEQGGCVFAQGLCWDKLIWVFLASALLGDIIETFYCGLVDGEWMNRSSVLYGPFSFVWGLGAVVLTITLRRLAEKNDRWVFAAGFVIGGAYEYMCSVVTELVFGTVFWDYSDMPLNIGGRTNVLFCFFWGLLAVVWIKLIYPPMSNAIEKLPVLPGKIATWIIVFFILCDAFLTGAAMLRYNTRPARPEAANTFEQFLDSQYGDARMEGRWPNMIVTG